MICELKNYMSILSKVLILIDDLGTTTKRNLFEYLPEEKNSVLLSALARLKNREMVKMIKNTTNNHYQITDLGRQHIFTDLDWIKNIFLDLQTYIVIFNVPDKFKSKREQFRKSMQNVGMKIIGRGILIGKMPSKNFIKHIVTKHKFVKYVKIYEVVANQYNLGELNKKIYQQFEKDAKSFLKYKKRFDKSHLRFRAKTLVYEFSQALKKDSLDYDIKNNLKKYVDLYQKIKVLCY